jgi:PAS domain S-box-containing protein
LITVNRIFIRNFLIFVAVVVTCAIGMNVALISGEKKVEQTGSLVSHSHNVIIEAEQFSSLIEGMLSAQRGYLLTGQEAFLNDYNVKKSLASETLAKLSELTEDNQSQQSRINEIRNYKSDFTGKLEDRATRIKTTPNPIVMTEVEIINNLKNNITRINSSVLQEEYDLLNERIEAMESRKSLYFKSLVIGIIVGAAILLVLNAFLLYSQLKQSRISTSLKETEDRLALAIEGTQDGIFDWNIRTDKVFYSRRFFDMLGYDRPATTGTTQHFTELLHPEDQDRVWQYIRTYLNGELSEYNQEFRLKHNSGRWMWIQARAKALYDNDGKPCRMVGAHSDISHLKLAQEKLQAEKEQAESATRAKSEFLAHMSHEIRTPLTAVSGVAEILLRHQDTLDDKQKHLVKTLHASSSSLKDLINDILDFSKIESGEVSLDEQAFDLDVLIEEVVSMMAMRAAEKGISFVFDYGEVRNAQFYGDKTRLRQIIVNLIGNAIKFTEQGGVTIKAEFELRDGNDFLCLQVADTGIGISPDNFDLVFERFKQADESVSRKYGGTGLGLPISRNLARLMGGDIILNSQTGKGSTFTVLLPQKISLEKTGPRGDKDLSLKLNDKIKSLLKGENKALLVEDYEGNIVVIGFILDDIGLKYDVARTGVQAVDKWQTNHYDIVLMDVQMPEMDGFTATKEIRRLEKMKNLPRTPIIGMTAHALVGDKGKCIEAGMDAYLPKPLVEEDLKKEILHFLDQKKMAA